MGLRDAQERQLGGQAVSVTERDRVPMARAPPDPPIRAPTLGVPSVARPNAGHRHRRRTPWIRRCSRRRRAALPGECRANDIRGSDLRKRRSLALLTNADLGETRPSSG